MSQLRPRFANTLATLSLTAAVALASATAVAQQPEHAHQTDHVTAQYGQQVAATTPAAQRKAATDSTEAFISAHKQWAQAQGASNKATALQSLIAKAEARRDMLAELIQSNPAEVLRVAIPEEKQVGMPAEVQAMLEMRFEVEGELEAIYEDYEDGTHKLRHFLKTSFGERFELKFAGQHPSQQSGTEVHVNGVLLDGVSEEDSTSGTMALDSADSSVGTQECCTESAITISEIPPAGTYTYGEQKTLVLLVNFQDKPEQPWSKDTVRNVIFGTSSDFFAENSSDQTWLSGDVAGWYTVPLSSTVCDQWTVYNTAKQMAADSGIDTSVYSRFVMAFPKNACGWAGLGTVGGKITKAWMNGYMTPMVASHELGHNFGLGHSNGLDCSSEINTGSCSTSYYANPLDTMGNINNAHFNAFQKARLGWLDYNGLPPVTTVTDSGTYTIESIAGANSGPKALRLVQNVDPNTGAETHYYVELRQPTGFDSFLSNTNNPVDNDNILNGVVIHRGRLGDYNSSLLLDMTPQSMISYDDFYDPALEVGRSFVDAEAGITVTTEWVDSNQAQVTVELGPQSCTNTQPTITATPGQSEWVAAGSVVSYSVTLTNNDSAACAPAGFSLTSTVPASWTAGFNSNNVTLSPGESITTTLTVTSATNAADGFYNIGIDTSGSTAASASVTYVVSNPVANTAPVAANDTTTVVENNSVSILVLNNDSDPDGDSLTISSFSQGNNGTVTIQPDNSVEFTPNPGFNGTDSFTYWISDGNGGSDSANVTVTVNPASNNTPIAVDDQSQLLSVSAVTINVLANDWDPENDVISIVSTTQGAKGSVMNNDDGTITYVPGKRFKNSDSFTYTISDGKASATASVSVNLQSSGNTGGGKGKGNGKK